MQLKLSFVPQDNPLQYYLNKLTQIINFQKFYYKGARDGFVNFIYCLKFEFD